MFKYRENLIIYIYIYIYIYIREREQPRYFLTVRNFVFK
jgi:hypothetical protein